MIQARHTHPTAKPVVAVALRDVIAPRGAVIFVMLLGTFPTGALSEDDAKRQGLLMHAGEVAPTRTRLAMRFMRPNQTPPETEGAQTCSPVASAVPVDRLRELREKRICLFRQVQRDASAEQPVAPSSEIVDELEQIDGEIAAFEKALEPTSRWSEALRTFGVGFVVGHDRGNEERGQRVGEARINSAGNVEISKPLDTTLEVALEWHKYLKVRDFAIGPFLMVNTEIRDPAKTAGVGIGLMLGFRPDRERTSTINLGFGFAWDRGVKRLPTDFAVGNPWPLDPQTQMPVDLVLTEEVSRSLVMLISFSP